MAPEYSRYMQAERNKEVAWKDNYTQRDRPPINAKKEMSDDSQYETALVKVPGLIDAATHFDFTPAATIRPHLQLDAITTSINDLDIVVHPDFENVDFSMTFEETVAEAVHLSEADRTESVADESQAFDKEITARLIEGDASQVSNVLSNPESEEFDAEEICEALCRRYNEIDPSELSPMEVLNAYHAMDYATKQSVITCAEELTSVVETAFEELGVSPTRRGDITIEEAKNSFEEYRDLLYEVTEKVYDDTMKPPQSDGAEAHLRVHLQALAKEL